MDCNNGRNVDMNAPQTPPPPSSPEQIAAEIVRHYGEHGGIHPNVEEGLQDSITAAVQSKQGEIEKLRNRAEQAEAALSNATQQTRIKERENAQLQQNLLRAEREGERLMIALAEKQGVVTQAERERDEALEALEALRLAARVTEIIDKHEKK